MLSAAFLRRPLAGMPGNRTKATKRVADVAVREDLVRRHSVDAAGLPILLRDGCSFSKMKALSR